MDVADKVVLIAGASSGIGLALARNLSARGAKVALAARRVERLEQAAGELSAGTRSALAIPLDVTIPGQCRQAVDTTVSTYGRLDILINNAGQGYFGSIENMPAEDFDVVVRTNLFGGMSMTQAAIPHLKASKGMIVSISSGLSRRVLPFLAAYGGSKSMLNALSDGLRMELAPDGVKVLTYGPPETESEFHARARVEPGMDAMAGGRRMARAEDVAERIVRAIIREKREVIEDSFLGVLGFFAPRMIDRLFIRVMVEKLRKPK